MIGLMILIWTFNFLIAKVGLRYLAPLTLASFRTVLAGLIMVALFVLSARPWPRLGWSDARALVPLGVFGVAMNQVMFTVGLNYTTVGHSSLIIGSGPMVILLLARLMGLERLTGKKIMGMALSFSGVAVLASEATAVVSTHAGQRSGTLLGDLITTLGSLAFAMFAVLGKRVAPRYDSLLVNTFAHVVGAALILPLAIHQALVLDWGSVAWQGWAALLYMAGMASVTAYLIWYWALRQMAASRLAVFGYLQPLIATGLGIFLLGERVSPQLVIGGSLIIGGVVLAELGPLDEPWRRNATESS